jgi:hypothetical protein
VSLQTRLTDLATAVATDVKQLRVFITGSSAGSLAGLTTVAKTDLVAAINEVNNKPAGTGDVTQADLDAATAQVKADILGAGVPAALDTLDELAAALGDDANFASSVTASLAAKQDAAPIGNPDTDLVAVYTAAKA